jgi:hypothetical protein
MKHLMTKTLEAILILLSIFILGIFVPFIMSLFIAMFTKNTLSECITTVPFCILALIGWLISANYLNDVICNE